MPKRLVYFFYLICSFALGSATHTNVTVSSVMPRHLTVSWSEVSETMENEVTATSTNPSAETQMSYGLQTMQTGMSFKPSAIKQRIKCFLQRGRATNYW